MDETYVGMSIAVIWCDLKCSLARMQSLFVPMEFCQAISCLQKSQGSLRMYRDHFVEDFKSFSILLVFAFAAHHEQPPADFHTVQKIFHELVAPKGRT